VRTTRSVVLGVAFLAAMTWSATAGADPFVDEQGWAKTGAVGPVAPQDGHLYVSVAAGQEQARTYLHLADPDITGTLTLAEAPDGIGSDGAALAACALTDAYTGGDSAPGLDCTRRAPLARSPDGDWTLPLDVFRGKLANGIAVIPDSDGPFTVAFDAAATSCACTTPAAATAPAEQYEPVTGAPTAAFLAPSAPPVDSPAITTPATSTTTVVDPITGTPARVPPRRAASPPFFVILIPIAIAAAVLWELNRRGLPGPMSPITVTGRRAGWGTAALLLSLLLLTASESTTFRLGFIAIVFIGAIGLHVLVNWAGELSLGHAAFVGLPAFVVAQAASHSGMTPILFVPLGVLIGVALGLVVASAALRARGLQVALVTLALGIAVIQFFFVRSWIIGPPAGLHVPTPSLLGWHMTTNRALLPVLVALVALASVSARWVFGSKLGRAFAFIRSDPSAAAAAGVPVNQYRALAYAIAGAYAGLAGASYVVWVQRVRPEAFPLTLGFTYLVIAVLAGRGGLGGLALSAILIEGGALFSIVPHSVSLYLGPIGLIYNATRYQKGFNGGIAELSRLINNVAKRKVPTMERPTIRVPVALGTLAIVAGFAALALAWYHTGNTDQMWIQNQEMISGGFGGIGLIIVGATVLIRDALISGRRDS
jgi:branched-chain amino acid transport system permease protein